MTSANPNFDLRSITIVPILSKNCVKRFKCGSPGIDSWASDKGYKHHAQDKARVFCARLTGSDVAASFYALSFSAQETKYLFNQDADRYSDDHAPFIFISFLAVQKPLQCNGIGTLMLMNALSRSYAVSKNVAVYGVALRPLNERVRKKYESHGFVVREEADNPLMILPIWHLRDLFERRGAEKTP